MEKRNLITNILIASVMSFAVVGCGVAYLYNEYQKPQVSRALSYDDENRHITLTADELNNYTFENLNNYVLSSYEDTHGGDYGTGTYSTYDNLHISSGYDGVYHYLRLNQGNGPFTFLMRLDPNSFTFIITTPENIDSFDSNLNLVLDSNFYNSFKSAIELDIQANASSDNINDSIFETLTSSLVSFIAVIGSGITSVIPIFYANSSLTVVGTLATIVVAVSLCYFLFRFIMGLIRLRG